MFLTKLKDHKLFRALNCANFAQLACS
uniref:Uncharacterized protein n=1 Tax=Rhizophora mucronata TaxID=61149 RepID=A0A2P2M8Y6_RHIMU